MGIFHAVLNGVPAGSVALIVCLQLLLTGALAGYLLSELVPARQWFGLFLGFLGTVFVIYASFGNFLYSKGLICAFVGLVAITIGTLFQKNSPAMFHCQPTTFIKLGHDAIPLGRSVDYRADAAEHFYFPHLSNWVANHCGVVWCVQYPDVLVCAEFCEPDCC